MDERDILRANHIGSLRQLLGRLTATTTGKMRKILQANDIQVITGKIIRSTNPTTLTRPTFFEITYRFPWYAKYVDNYKRSQGQGLSKKWMTKKGRLSKIPSDYQNPMLDLVKGIEQNTGKIVAQNIEDIIQDIKKKYKRIE